MIRKKRFESGVELQFNSGEFTWIILDGKNLTRIKKQYWIDIANFKKICKQDFKKQTK